MSNRVKLPDHKLRTRRGPRGLPPRLKKERVRRERARLRLARGKRLDGFARYRLEEGEDYGL
jgi:hypothetical protein